LCATLVIYQETLHDTWSTKYKSYSLCCFENLEENLYHLQYFHVILKLSASALSHAFSYSFGFQSVNTVSNFLLVHHIYYVYNIQFFLVFSKFLLSSLLPTALITYFFTYLLHGAESFLRS